MVDISQTQKKENEKLETPVSADLGLPKPIDATMHEALKSTVETLRQGQQVEKAPVVETAKEALPQAAEVLKPEVSEVIVPKIETTTPTVTTTPSITIQTKDELQEEIEAVLGESLEDDYKRMSPEVQLKFKIKGEQTAKEISKILRSSKIQIKKIINLILEWLRIIPGVNKYFLTQEAKIKTDRVMLLHDEIIKEKGKII